MNRKDVVKIFDEALNSIDDTSLRNASAAKMIDPVMLLRKLENESEEKFYETWLVINIGERDTGIAYTDEGVGGKTHPWELVYVSSSKYRAGDCWYKSLEECVRDSGYF